MTIGTSNSTTLSFIKELIAGETPVSPALQLLRITGESLQSSNSTTMSEELRDDRATSDLVLTDQSNAGDINCEFSSVAFDELLEGAMLTDSTWTSTDNGGEATIASTGTGFTDSGNGLIASGIQVGQYISLSGFTDTTIDGFYRITSLTAGSIDTFPVPPAIEAEGATVTYKGQTIKSGKADHSYTFQKAHRGVSPVVYQNFRGVRVSTMNMELSVGDLAKVSFGLLGVSGDVTESIIAGQTELAKHTNDIMNAVGDVTNISAVGVGISTVIRFTSLTLSYDNALRELKALGTLGSIDVVAGTIVANATINPYFEDKELLESFLNNGAFSLSWQLSSSDGYDYIFTLPNVKFSTQNLAAGSKDTDMIVESEVQAILDPVSLVTAMRIDRFTP